MEGKAYTVKQVADLSGASVRALHHYESMGLLVPKRRANGYRSYDDADIATLQQILVYRACGMPLAEIGEVLANPAYDAKAVLARHLGVLGERKRELEALMSTVEKTIRSLEGECDMTNEEKFEGLKRAALEENEARYGAEARERYGEAAVDAANERMLAMDQQEWNDRGELEKAIIEQLKTALAEGDVQSPAARQLASMHARWIEMSWGEGAYSPEAHRGLAQGYLADDRFRAYYDERAGEGATEFLVAALEVYLG